MEQTQTENEAACGLSDLTDVLGAKSQRWQDGKRKDKRMDWQQIETAPTDGTAVLVTNGRGVWIAKHKAIFQSGYKPDSPWFCLMLNKDHIPGKFRAGKPTHWMPLPEAPNVEVRRGPATGGETK